MVPPEAIFSVLAWILMMTSTMQYHSSKLPMPMLETWALYMKPSCSMLNESFQPMPLPFYHYLLLPCPYIKKNSLRKLPHCINIQEQAKVCWTKKIPPTIKVICPDCTHGLEYHHNLDPDLFLDILLAKFPITTTQECNHRSARHNPQAYTPQKFPLHKYLSKIRPSKKIHTKFPKIRPNNPKQPHR